MHIIWNGSIVVFGGPGFILMYVAHHGPGVFHYVRGDCTGAAARGPGYPGVSGSRLSWGLLTQQEYNQLGTIRGRMGASFNALSQGGFKSWRACRQLNQMASELAFHRSRVARGIRAADAHEREAAYRQALADLLRQLRAPAR